MNKYKIKKYTMPLDFIITGASQIETDVDIATFNLNVPFDVHKMKIRGNYRVNCDNANPVMLTCSIVYDNPIMLLSKRFINEETDQFGDGYDSCSMDYVFEDPLRLNNQFTIAFKGLGGANTILEGTIGLLIEFIGM